MKKFILLYNGSATPAEQMTSEQTEKVMGGWKAWMEKIGDAMVDMGQPMANGKSVVDDGSSATAPELSGYSIIRASDMDAALKLVNDHPFLSDNPASLALRYLSYCQHPACS
ncbi:hypothetical protein HYX70_00955 [Candidatus Saccharibacteria bacterium]|nr:hypothetical protein [Candidatus Saccharibacteria bacterium]